MQRPWGRNKFGWFTEDQKTSRSDAELLRQKEALGFLWGFAGIWGIIIIIIFFWYGTKHLVIMKGNRAINIGMRVF